MVSQHIIRGLYAITPDCLDTELLLRKSRLCLQGGARILQYRNKLADEATRIEQASALRKLSREFSAAYIVNDHPQLAAQVDADGVHIGANDGELESARHILGKDKIIGVSCYNRASLARKAIAAGADYVAFGAFFPSGVKPLAVQADMELLHRIRAEFSVPLVAIGGITSRNAAPLLAAGADALAVISAVFDADDIAAAAHDFSKLFIQEPAP